MHDIHSYPGPDAPPTSRSDRVGGVRRLGLPLAGPLRIEDLSWGYRAYEDVAALREATPG